MTAPYTMMPFSFERLPSGDYFLSNLGGDFQFLATDVFERFVRNKLTVDDPEYFSLASGLFLSSGGEGIRTLTASKLLSRTTFVMSGPRLHIVALTRACNCHCDYCHASSLESVPSIPRMTRSTADAVSKMIMASPARDITVEFQGGEALLAWDILRYMVEKIRVLNLRAKKSVTFVLCTNLIGLTDEMIAYIIKRGIEVSTSLDGPADLHDAHRHAFSGSAHSQFIERLLQYEKKSGKRVSPLLTSTRDSLENLRSIIDHYIEIGRAGIFIRPLNPFGRAALDPSLGYTAEEFAKAYIDAVEYIISMNRQGVRFVEFFASLLLRRIYTPFDTGFVDMQFPAGAGLSVLVYDESGDIYPSDEARMLAIMGDPSFCLGNVDRSSPSEVFSSPIVRTIFSSSIPALIPGCSSCPYSPYCGVDPIRAYAEHGDVFPFSENNECRKNRIILRWLFGKIRDADSELQKIFLDWIV